MSAFWKPGTDLQARNRDCRNAFVERDDYNSVSQDGLSNGSHFNFSRAPISQQRLNLPISKHRRQILYAMEEFKVIVIVGETGSGKSTQIPQYLMEGGWSAPPKHTILCTQPRRLAAISLADRVALETNTVLGTKVGHNVRFQSQFHPDQTHILFATDGMLVRTALEDPLLHKFSVIMVDEAHERGLNSDLVLGILKKIRRKRRNLRVVICSATIDAPAFLDFFCDKYKEDGVIMSIDGRQYPVDIMYRQIPCDNYLKDTVKTALQIHFQENYENGDILCFLPSGEDIDRAILYAREEIERNFSMTKKNSGKRRADLLPLYGTLPYHLQTRVFQTQNHTKSINRRIIFATNIAETSVTVPNIRHVVDSGFVKLPYFDPTNGFERLIVCPISRASAKQRAGRAGRISPGKCYRMYTEKTFMNMRVSTHPEILRTNLASFVLTLKALGIDNILKFDLINVPASGAMSNALECLYALDAIRIDSGAKSENQSAVNCDLTPLGLKMSTFPVEPRAAKMLLSSLEMDCSDEILSVAAILQVREIFLMPRSDQQKLDFAAAMNEIVDRSGDHVTVVNVFKRYRNDDEDDCRANFVNYLALNRAKEIRAQLRRFLRRYGRITSADLMEESLRSKLIRKCVTSGFFFNIAKLGNDGRYYTLRGKHGIQISDRSAMKEYGEPSELILFGETYDGSRGGLEVRMCSSIEGKWLRELAPHYWN